MLTQRHKEEALRFIRSLQRPSFTFRDLVRHLDLSSDLRRSLQHFLDELDHQGAVHRIRRGRYALPAREALVSGVLSCHRDGYGFVAPEDRSTYRQDVFVHIRNMGEALHGDRVLVRVSRRKKPAPRRGRRSSGADNRERLEGTVVRVLERRSTRIVGRYYRHSRFPYVVPLEPQVLYDIQVLPGGAGEARDGQVVVVALTTPPGKYQKPEGRIVEILGDPDTPGIEYRIVEHKFGLPVQFSAEALDEVREIPHVVTEADLRGREDFRGEPTVTIDGENAQDFDDAITLSKISADRYLLGVHIADVSHYVREGSALDRDAHARGTSVYFPDRSIPMLPPELSSGICSLKPREDRLVFSALLEVDGSGNVTRSRFAEGVLHSNRRMTYTTVARILVERDPEERERHAELVPLFETMEELCRILNHKRMIRGAVDFDLPEPEIRFDDNGKIISVVAAERNVAHRIIEEFMLLANETVAERLLSSGGPQLFRVHEEPDAAKVEDFARFAQALGFPLESRAGRYRPADFQRFCHKLEGKKEGRFLAYLMLRSFMQARYSEQNLAHFGLAAEHYTHFTSPIRRYPDLVVHRLLKECLKPEPSREWQEKMIGQLPEIARHTSARERNADDAEREIEKLKKVEFMSDKVGDDFEGIVFSVARQGFFVELLEHFVEGFVPASTLVDDNYQYKEKNHTWIGEKHRRRIQLGVKVRVCLDLADRESRRLLFSMIDFV